MRFRRRGFSGGNRTREPLFWHRNTGTANAVNIQATSAGITIFTPSEVAAGNEDQRFTIRRLILDFVGRIQTSHATDAATDVFPITMGIEIVSAVTGSVDNPTLAGTTDKQQDWMYLRNDTLTGTGAAVNVPLTITDNLHVSYGRLDIRTMRKVTQAETVRLVVREDTALGSGNQFATCTLDYKFICSVLLSRTMRR